jgi:hypothetical protein
VPPKASSLPERHGRKRTANVVTDSVRLLNLMGGNGCIVIDGRSRDQMLGVAPSYIDTLLL